MQIRAAGFDLAAIVQTNTRTRCEFECVYRPAPGMGALKVSWGMLSLRLASQDVPVEELVRDALWFPEDFQPARQLLSFTHASRETLASEPFLDQRWTHDGSHHQAPLDVVAAAIGPRRMANLNFIWHTSFCCSTLVAHALDRPGHNLALSEPLVLVSMADAKRSASLEQGWQLSRLPETVFRLLGRPECEGAQVLVKPSNFANALVGDAARLTAGKSLFLYSDLASFLVSIAKSGVSLRKYVRRLFSTLTANMRDQLPWSWAEIFQMSDLEIAALAWHMQITEFRTAWAQLGPSRAASLDCDAFLRHPAQAMAKLDAFFELGLGEEWIGQVLSGPRFKQHAKVPGEPFDTASRQEQAAATRRQFGKDLDRVVEWSYRACPATPHGAPLPNPVM